MTTEHFCDICHEPVKRGYICTACFNFESKLDITDDVRDKMRSFRRSAFMTSSFTPRLRSDPAIESVAANHRSVIGPTWRRHLVHDYGGGGVYVTPNGKCYHNSGCTYAVGGRPYTKSSASYFLRPCCYCFPIRSRIHTRQP